MRASGEPRLRSEKDVPAEVSELLVDALKSHGCVCMWLCGGVCFGRAVWAESVDVWCRRVEVGCLFAAGPAVSVASLKKASAAAYQERAPATPAPNLLVTFAGERRVVAEAISERRASRVLQQSLYFDHVTKSPPRRGKPGGTAQQNCSPTFLYTGTAYTVATGGTSQKQS
jgi:hypothetical protein